MMACNRDNGDGERPVACSWPARDELILTAKPRGDRSTLLPSEELRNTVRKG